jgi:hypothetical protein
MTVQSHAALRCFSVGFARAGLATFNERNGFIFASYYFSPVRGLRHAVVDTTIVYKFESKNGPV